MAVLAALVFSAFLGRRSLWFDEALTAWVAGLPTAELWDVVGKRSANLGLYYLLMDGWTAVAGTGEVALRAPSVAGAVATVPLVAVLGRRLYGGAVTWLAPVLLVLNAFFVSLAQEARPYALLALGAAASSYLFVAGIERPTRGRWAAYALVTAAAVYLHAFAVLLPLAHASSLLLLPPRRIPWRHVLGAGALAGAIVAPLAVVSLTQGGDLVSWIPPLSASRLLRFGVNLAGSATRPGAVAHVHLAVTIGLVAIAAVAATARPGPEGLARWRTGFAVMWLVVPLGSILVISLVRPLLVDRYLVGSSPALALVAAWGITRIRPRPAAIAAGAAAAVTGALLVAALHSSPLPKEDWRAAAQHLGDRAAPGDAVYVSGSFGLPGLELPLISLEYYRDRVEPPVPGPLRTAGELIATLRGGGAPSPTGRVWVVVAGEPELRARGPEIAAALRDAGYLPGELRWFPGRYSPIAVSEWVREG